MEGKNDHRDCYPSHWRSDWCGSDLHNESRLQLNCKSGGCKASALLGNLATSNSEGTTMATIHNFHDSGMAYDMCQCDENVKTGDILNITCENVVGLAHTWPVAVTINFGSFHAFKEDATEETIAGMFTREQVEAAITVARSRRLPVQPVFKSYMDSTQEWWLSENEEPFTSIAQNKKERPTYY